MSNIDFTGIGQFLLGVSAVLGVYVNWRSNQKLQSVVKGVEHNTNSLKDELVALTKKSAFQAGKKEAEDEARGK